MSIINHVPIVRIKQLSSIKEQNLAIEIFKNTWGSHDSSEITPNLLQAMVYSGAYLSGAFIESKCVGAAFAFPATYGGLHLHSHMTAVLPSFRDSGIGFALKTDQFNWAKKNNYSAITWTYDPLVLRNARFNILKIGVDVVAYYPNFYGKLDDLLNVSDESDRLLVSWNLEIKRLGSNKLISKPKKNDVLIQIPNDIVSMRGINTSQSRIWRIKVREQFTDSFTKGGKVIGLSVNNEYVIRI